MIFRLFSSSSFLIGLFLVLILNACSDTQLASRHSLSRVNPKQTILVYSLDNYTDTPVPECGRPILQRGFLSPKATE
jgi:hypothetical protein